MRLGNLETAFLQILRNIDHEVSHLLQFVHHVEVVDAGLIVLALVFDAFDLLVAQIVAHVVDAFLCCISPELMRFIP